MRKSTIKRKIVTGLSSAARTAFDLSLCPNITVMVDWDLFKSHLSLYPTLRKAATLVPGDFCAMYNVHI